jgi:hypothetical protein
MLIFGTGHDSQLWLEINSDGTTLFLEHSLEWREFANQRCPNISIRELPDFGLTVHNSIQDFSADDARFKPPSDLMETEWDVILIDGPPGYSQKDPGRAVPIYWASKLATERTHIFVDDYERNLERHFTDRYLRNRGTASYVLAAGDNKSHRQLFWSVGTIIPQPRQDLVLTVATPDYARKWRFCIDSQHRYCRRHNFDHHVIDPTAQDVHPAWAKLEEAIKQLSQGHNILLIDADAEITDNCPPFTEILNSSPSKDIFYVLGISGRPNSGMLILRGGASKISTSLLRECINRRHETVPREDFVTVHGENGHVIWMLKREPYKSGSQEIGRAWNCTIPEAANDAFIRHYTNFLRRNAPSSSQSA